MGMYIGAYGLTSSGSVLTSVFMVCVAVALVCVAIWIWRPGSLHANCRAGRAGSGLLHRLRWTWTPQVARYNVDAYLSGQLTPWMWDHLGGLSEWEQSHSLPVFGGPRSPSSSASPGCPGRHATGALLVDWENGAIALEPWEEPLLRSWTWTQSPGPAPAGGPGSKLQAELQE